MSGVTLWRPAFVLFAVLLMIGAPQHPDGSMVEMLGHPAWVRAHSLMLAGFVVLFIGLLVFRATPSLPDQTQRWTRYALIGTALQIVEMVLHTAAVVDHANLASGDATPVLTTHLAASLVFYPAFSATVVGLIVVAQKRGLSILREVAETEDSLPFEFGPPRVLKPTFELLGEELLALGHVVEARDAFQRAVERNPARTLSVQGLQRASSAS